MKLDSASKQDDLPMVFDPVSYKARYPDLAGMGRYQLWNHFVNHGMQEGRIGHNFSSRLHFGSLLNRGQRILEISPWNDPYFIGENVRYADVFDRETLIQRAIALGEKPPTVPEMHYLISPTNLSDSISEKFDLVASSHVIEHQPNFLEHLREVGKVLMPGGRYVLTVPDKRYCFDHFKSESNFADIVDADLSKVTKHTMRTLLQRELFRTHNHAHLHWDGNHGEAQLTLEKIRDAKAAFEASKDEYQDAHAWYFTPTSFQKIIRTSHELGLQPFQVEALYPTTRNMFEFYVVLRLADSK